MMALLSHRGFQIVLLLMLLGGAVYLRFLNPPVIERITQMTFDYYNRLMPRTSQKDVVIVDIDEESIRAVGQWPWPRTIVAKLPTALKALGAKSVAFDMVFSERDRTSPAEIAKSLPADMGAAARALAGLPDNETLFAQSIAAAGNVVTGFVGARQLNDSVPVQKAKFLNTGLEPAPEKFMYQVPYFTSTLPVLAEAGAGSGSFSMIPENDGIVRRVPLLIGHEGRNVFYPALSLEALRVAMGKSVYQVESYGRPAPRGYGITQLKIGDYAMPTDATGSLRVYYAGHQNAVYVPAWKVLSGQANPAQFRDKIVFIGTSAIGLLDLRSSPLDRVLPGVEVHAEVVEQILHGQFLQRPSFLEGAELLVSVGVSLCMIFLAPFIGAGILALVAAAITGGGMLLSLYAYQVHGFLVAPVYPSLVIMVIFMASSVLTNLRTEMEKRAVRHAFGHYIAPALMAELAENPARLKLGGEVRDLSVMFTDIRNFTSISEKMDPADLIRMMNDFLTPMTSCVMGNRGTVDKYMGDAMMAFWNAPLDDEAHARHACKTALEMLAALDKVNASLGGGIVLKAGIGINTGKCSVGNMGSKQRFAYSALGDAVNLASRLEGQTKGYGVSVMISDSTRIAAPEFAAVEIDLLAVKGRAEAVRVHALLGDAAMAMTEDFKVFAARHMALLAHYRAHEWDSALLRLEDCRTRMPSLSGLYDLYAARIATFRQAPPPEGWDGIWIAQGK
jgi:adenylate cyclase